MPKVHKAETVDIDGYADVFIYPSEVIESGGRDMSESILVVNMVYVQEGRATYITMKPETVTALMGALAEGLVALSELEKELKHGG